MEDQTGLDGWWQDSSGQLRPEIPGQLLHERTYKVRASRLDAERLLLQGSVIDEKPPGVLIEGDPESIRPHEMRIEMEISIPNMVILTIDVEFVHFPRVECPNIIDLYDSLVGLSLSRGFMRALRDQLGGPRGCSHTTALIQAMAPVVFQAMWSTDIEGTPAHLSEPRDPVGQLLNSCHVWAGDSDVVRRVRMEGRISDVPLFVRPRLKKLGQDADDWLARVHAS